MTTLRHNATTQDGASLSLSLSLRLWQTFQHKVRSHKFKFERASQYVAKAVSKLDWHAVEMKNMLKSFKNITHPQFGNALYVYNTFIRYQTNCVACSILSLAKTRDRALSFF